MSFPIVKGRAYKIEDAKNRWYMFSPIGLPVHLFNNPRTEREITHIAKEVNLPVELRIQALSDELELICQDPAYQDAADYFGEFPVFSVYRDGELTEVAKIRIADLSDWTIPADLDATVELVVDPVIGRLFFTQGTTSAVTVSYSYGFPGQTGGGPYTRPDALVLPDPVNTREKSWNLPGTGPMTLAGTLADWETWMPAVPDTRAIITLTDSLTHAVGDGLVIDFCGRKKGTLIIQAADEERPVIDGSITIRGCSPDCSLTVSGLLIHGTITIEPGSVGSLTLTHCTLTPGGRLDPKTLCPETGEPSIHFASPASGNEVTEIALDHCITGALCLPPERTRLSVTDSIIQACPPQEALPVAISGENGSTGPASDIRRTTILGHVRTRELYASGVIFNDSVMVEKDQEGCVRYSHVPHGSITPRRFRCQPDLALARETKLHTLAGRVFTDSEINDVISRMAPSFTSVLYHDSGYCHLGHDCVPGLTNGGEDGSEMGAYSFLLQPQREANLRAVLDEYLRFGLEAGIFYIP